MRARAAALHELVGVFITGTLVARLVSVRLNVPSAGLRDLAPGQSPDFSALAFSTTVNLLLRYGLILGLAFAIGWWHRRRRPAAYGVTPAGLSLRGHVAIAGVLFAVGGFVPRLLLFLKDHLDLGASPPHWDLIAPRASVDYWLYMAAGSFVLVPIFEELFARGYVQTRLGEDFGPGRALVMTALMFALSHRQYFLPSVLGVGMVLALIFASLAGGFVRHRYGTLIPVVLAHALGNVPVRGWGQAIVLGGMVVVILLAHKLIVAHAREASALIMMREVLGPAGIVVLTVFAVLAIAAISRDALLPAGVAALVVALVLERQRTSAPLSTSTSRSTER